MVNVITTGVHQHLLIPSAAKAEAVTAAEHEDISPQQSSALAKAFIARLLHSEQIDVTACGRPCHYQAHTEDFGRRILQLLHAQPLSESDAGQIEGAFASQNIVHDLTLACQRLGIELRLSRHTYPLRDYFISECSQGLVRGPPADHKGDDLYEKAVGRGVSGLMYSNMGFLNRTFCRSMEGTAGFSRNNYLPCDYDLARLFKQRRFEPRFKSDIEGGNHLILSGSDGTKHCFLGLQHKYANHHYYRLTKSRYGGDASLDNHKAVIDDSHAIRVAREMFGQGVFKINDRMGMLSHTNIGKARAYERIQRQHPSSLGKYGDCPSLLQARNLRLIAPFTYKANDVAHFKTLAGKFLTERSASKALVAEGLSLRREHLHHVAQAAYHTDLFMKGGPGHTVLLQSYRLTVAFCRELEQQAASFGLTSKDLHLLKIYRETAEQLDRELTPLLELVRAKAVKAGFPVIPLPGVFMFVPQNKPAKTYHYNFINAVSGWSDKTGRYYWIVDGISVGDRLGAALRDVLSAYLDALQPGIEVYYLGRNPLDAQDYSEGMGALNRSELNASGIHCMSFEIATADHKG